MPTWADPTVEWSDPDVAWGVGEGQPAFQSIGFQEDAFQLSPAALGTITQTAPSFTQTAESQAAYVLSGAQELPSLSQELDTAVIVPIAAASVAPAFSQTASENSTVKVEIGGGHGAGFAEDAFEPDAFQAPADVPVLQPALRQSAVGGIFVHGTTVASIHQALGVPQQAAAGTLEVHGTATQTGPGPDQSASVTVPPTGSITQEIPALSQSLEAALIPQGPIAQVMPGFTQSLRAQEVRWDEWPASLGAEWAVHTEDEWLVRQ